MLFRFLKEIVRPAAPAQEGHVPISGANTNHGATQVQSENKAKYLAEVADDLLAESLKKRVQWIAESNPKPPVGELSEIWSSIPNGSKWHHYFSIYEKVFAPVRSTPVKILEIGIDLGASLKLWRQYFSPDSQIVGIDINANCARFEDTANNIHVRIGSQSDDAFLQSIVDEFGTFDLIIDDGSHRSSDMLASFNFLFLSGLKEQGIYLVEDLHANYWPAWKDTKISFIDMAKHLVDVMHHHYAASFQSFSLGDLDRLPAFSVPLITTLIDEIRFFDSIVVLYKRSKPTPPVCQGFKMSGRT